MGGAVAHFTEVAGAADDAFAEVKLPHAVDPHAGDERVIRGGEPLGESRAAESGLGIGGRIGEGPIFADGGGEDAGGHDGAFGTGAATVEEVGGRGVATGFVDRHRGGQLRFLAVEGGDFGEQLLAFGDGFGGEFTDEIVFVDVGDVLFKLTDVELLAFGAFRFGRRYGEAEVVGLGGVATGDDAVAEGLFEGLDQILGGFGEGVDGGRFGFDFGFGGGVDEGAFEGFEWEEDGLDAVVVFLGDGVEFMIVAAGAAYGHAEEAVGGGDDEVVEFVKAGLFVFDIVFRAEAEEAGGDPGVGVVRVEFVAGELFLQETIEGFVGVEGVDDVVAIAEGVVAVAVELVAAGVGIADDVEPVASPAFAVVGRGEELVDEAGPGVGAIIIDEGGDLSGGGREAYEVEIGAANEDGLCGRWGGGEPFGGPFEGEEVIDSSVGGGGGADRFLEGPEFAFGFGDGPIFRRGEGAGGDGGGGELGAGVDPGFQCREVGGRDLFAGGHLGLVEAGGETIEAAFFGFAGDQGRAALATFDHGFAGAEIEFGDA